MPAVLCPKCRWPLSRAEARSGKCPFCAAPLGEAEAVRSRRRELPPPVDERGTRLPLSHAARPMIRGVLILLMLAAAGGGLYYGISTGVTRYLGGADPPAGAASEESKEFEEAFLAPPAPPESEAAPVQAQKPAAAAPASVPPASPPAPGAKSDVRRVLPQEITVAHNVTKIDSPQGEYTVEPLAGEALLRLRGKVKTLRIKGLNGDAFLEAEALEAQEIIFAGPVGGRAKARVRAPGGSVEFRMPINGQARVTVDATGGKVTFLKPEGGHAGAEIGGQTHLAIRAKEVDFQCPTHGDASVLALLTSGGRLRFTLMDGKSHIYYRKAEAGDPDPVITWGIVRDDSRCRENK